MCELKDAFHKETFGKTDRTTQKSHVCVREDFLPTGDSLSIIQMAPIHESVADLDTWDDIYGVAAEKGLLGIKRDIENNGANETIRGFIKASKRFNPNRFRRLA